jgi:hypothetical protein
LVCISIAVPKVTVIPLSPKGVIRGSIHECKN